MRKILAQGAVSINAPPEVCFDRYLDLAAYPTWEPNTRSAEILNHGSEGRIIRIAFHIGRKVLGLPIVDLSYSLRCEHHWIPGGGFWIKFDAVEGDLDHVMTVVRLQPESPIEAGGPQRTQVSYHSAIGAHYALKLAVIAPFIDHAVTQHLKAFRSYVHQCEKQPIQSFQPALG